MKIGKKKNSILDQSKFAKLKRPPKCFVLQQCGFYSNSTISLLVLQISGIAMTISSHSPPKS